MRVHGRTLAFGAALMLAAATLVAAPVGAAGTTLETTWADAGVLALPWSFGPVRDTADIASAPAGQLLLAGGDENAHGCITRLTPAAELDPGFSTSAGLVGSVCDFGDESTGRFVAIQPAGTGLVAAADLPTSRRVVRLNEFGGTPGLQDLPGSYAGAGGGILDVTPLSDGRTALLETRTAGGPGWVTILESGGGPFVGDWQVPDFDATHRFRPTQILPGPGGRILLVGEVARSTGPITAVLRTDAEGRRDTSFSGDGFSDGPPTSAGRPGRGAVGFGGTVVLAAAKGSAVSVRRITSTGALDTTFRTSGTSATVPSGATGIAEVVRRTDNRWFLVFGGGDTTTSVHVARVTRSGALDTTFSGDGYASYDAGVGHVRAATSAALAPDGDLYVFADDPSWADDPEVLRFDGTHDTAPPAPVMTRPTSMWTLSSTVAMAWTATDASPSITTDLRAWSATYGGPVPATPTTVLSASTARSRTLTGVAGGTTVCAAARARDAIPQLSPWGAQRCSSVPLRPSQLTRSKGVTSKAAAGAYSGRVLSATKKGATITRTRVLAKRLALVVTTCSSCGKVKVYLGSTLLKTVSLRSATTHRKVIVTVASFTSVRSGTVRVKVVSSGKKVLLEGIGVSKV